MEGSPSGSLRRFKIHYPDNNGRDRVTAAARHGYLSTNTSPMRISMATFEYDPRFVTQHAANQARDRKISMEDIVAAVSGPELKTTSEQKSSSDLYWKKIGYRVLIVVVGAKGGKPKQVTSTYWAAPAKQAAFKRLTAA